MTPRHEDRRRDDRTPTPVGGIPILTKDEIAEACQIRCSQEGGPMFNMGAKLDAVTATINQWRGGRRMLALVVAASTGLMLAAGGLAWHDLRAKALEVAKVAATEAVNQVLGRQSGASQGTLDRELKTAETRWVIPSAEAQATGNPRTKGNP